MFMINSDIPIKRSDEDKLNRKDFAKEIASIILNYKEKDNLVFGLFGQWGSGKTSVINMILEEIKKETNKEKDYAKKAIIVNFSPWNIIDEDQLIKEFFISLRSSLSGANVNKLTREIGETLDEYADALDLLSPLSVGALPAKYGLKVVGKSLKKEKSIEKTKDELSKRLAKLGCKIIVVIDDIDRLTDQQIRTVFQLVKQVACLPNIIYLLSMDREVVIDALNKVQNGKGKEYLEKIVQVTMELPKVDTANISAYLLDKLNPIVEEYSDDTFSVNHFSRIYYNCVLPECKTIRDVLRLVNEFELKCKLLNGEVELSDLLLVTLLEQKHLDIYNWIFNHKQLVLKNYNNYGIFFVNEKDKNIKSLRDLIGKDVSDSELTLKVLYNLFPVVARKIDYYFPDFDDDTDKKLNSTKRIASEYSFDAYFQLDKNKPPFSKGEIENSMNHMSLDELDSFLKSIDINNDDSIAYFETINEKINQLSEDRTKILTVAILKNATRFIDVRRDGGLLPSAYRLSEICIDQLLRRIVNSYDRYKLLSKTLEEADYDTYDCITAMLQAEELHHGRFDNSKDDQKCFLSEGDLEALEKDWLKKTQELSLNKEKFMSLSEIELINYCWEILDKDNCYNYFKDVLEDVKYVISYFAHYVSYGYDLTHNKTIRRVDLRFLKKYIVIDTAFYEDLNQFDKSFILNNFNKEEIRKIAYGFASVKNAVVYEDTERYIENNEIDALIDSWKGSQTSYTSRL